MHIIPMGMFLTNFLNCNLAEAYVMQDLMFIGFDWLNLGLTAFKLKAKSIYLTN